MSKDDAKIHAYYNKYNEIMAYCGGEMCEVPVKNESRISPLSRFLIFILIVATMSFTTPYIHREKNFKFKTSKNENISK